MAWGLHISVYWFYFYLFIYQVRLTTDTIHQLTTLTLIWYKQQSTYQQVRQVFDNLKPNSSKEGTCCVHWCCHWINVVAIPVLVFRYIHVAQAKRHWIRYVGSCRGSKRWCCGQWITAIMMISVGLNRGINAWSNWGEFWQGWANHRWRCIHCSSLWAGIWVGWCLDTWVLEELIGTTEGKPNQQVNLLRIVYAWMSNNRGHA